MAISISDLSVDVGCPTSPVPLNTPALSQATASATVKNDGDAPETVSLNLSVSDGTFSGSNYDSATLDPGETLPLSTNSGCGGEYSSPGQYTVTATATIGSEQQSTTCTFTVGGGMGNRRHVTKKGLLSLLTSSKGVVPIRGKRLERVGNSSLILLSNPSQLPFPESVKTKANLLYCSKERLVSEVNLGGGEMLFLYQLAQPLPELDSLPGGRGSKSRKVIGDPTTWYGDDVGIIHERRGVADPVKHQWIDSIVSTTDGFTCIGPPFDVEANADHEVTDVFWNCEWSLDCSNPVPQVAFIYMDATPDNGATLIEPGTAPLDRVCARTDDRQGGNPAIIHHFEAPMSNVTVRIQLLPQSGRVQYFACLKQVLFRHVSTGGKPRRSSRAK